ncbi:putative membrane protein (DNA-damage-inducible protein) [Plesiocystis pacifica SIR-1]|uniref:Putative membrane protein (DNA-damage-inducible protein) n=1 Tax=Plesiocystis pacifica SIR-1 TaxID=391625 RepID=A6FYK7_9BACT|nr:MATE family efflux transporter [Plesiocystis pacifica]EDM81279.1 putative membrane protein (DNA-damage-inducible protein) [Plesiocystis pacifica SIR-1]
MAEPPDHEAAPGLRRRFLGLAVPSIVASLMVPVASLVDAAILGHLEVLEPLAGVALAGVVFDMLYWSFGFLRMGTTGLSAQAFGRGEVREVRALLLRAGLIACVLAGLILATQGPVAWLAFAVLDGEPAVEAAARAYFDARIWAAPAVLLNFCVTGWLLGLQRTRPILVLATVSNGTNVALDYLFIVEWGWGAAGAGWATMASQVASLLVALPIARRAWRELADGASGDADARSPDASEVLSWTRLRPLLSLGRDIWLRTLALIGAFAIFTNFSAAFSSTLLAANALLLRVLGLASYFVDGFAHATESLTGESAGRDDRGGLRRLLLLALRWGLGTGAAFAGAFIAFPGLFGLLTDQPELLATVVAARGWLVVVLLLGSLAYVLDGYFIGLAAGRTLSRAMLLSFGVGFLPLALASRYAGGGPSMLWFALIAFMAARGLTLAAAVPGTLRQPSA